jgi:hypothetical protein
MGPSLNLAPLCFLQWFVLGFCYLVLWSSTRFYFYFFEIMACRLTFFSVACWVLFALILNSFWVVASSSYVAVIFSCIVVSFFYVVVELLLCCFSILFGLLFDSFNVLLDSFDVVVGSSCIVAWVFLIVDQFLLGCCSNPFVIAWIFFFLLMINIFDIVVQLTSKPKSTFLTLLISLVFPPLVLCKFGSKELECIDQIIFSILSSMTYKLCFL